MARADSRPVHEAGGTEVQELAFLVATGAEYVRALMMAGMSAEAACRTILFTISVGADYQVEMSKLRAARRMWARVAEVFGVTGEAAGVKLQAVTSRRMLTRRDPWVNILRNTAACFAAGVGGADIVTVRAHALSPQLRDQLLFEIRRDRVLQTLSLFVDLVPLHLEHLRQHPFHQVMAKSDAIGDAASGRCELNASILPYRRKPVAPQPS